MSRAILCTLLTLAWPAMAGAEPTSDEPSITVAQAVRSANGGIDLELVASGPDPVRISQVQVDAAYWQHHQDPPGPLEAGTTARLHIPYPTVMGEPHRIVFFLHDGTTLEAWVPPSR